MLLSFIATCKRCGVEPFAWFRARGNSARSRNLRLTAVRSFFRYAALEAPAYAGLIQRVLAIPNQRQPRALVHFLTRPEIDALLAVPNQKTWLGRRDHAFLLTALQTGLRLPEMTALRHEDISLGRGAHVHCIGKGRKERCTPLTKSTIAVLKAWIREQGRNDSKILFPSVRGGRLSAVGVSTCLQGMWCRREGTALHWPGNVSHLMCFDTPQPWNFCSPVLIAR